MSKLLERSKVCYTLAQDSYKRIGDNDAFLDECCFELQQSIEMALKYIIEVNGAKYYRTHDIRRHLEQLIDLRIEIPNKDAISLMAQTLNSWEAESRYLDDFFATIDDVQSVTRYARDLIRFAETFVSDDETGVKEITAF